MNWTDTTERERRLTEAREWEQREFGPLEEIARSRPRSLVERIEVRVDDGLPLFRASPRRSARRLELVRLLFSGGWR